MSADINLIRNGDFSQGQANWPKVVSASAGFGYFTGSAIWWTEDLIPYNPECRYLFEFDIKFTLTGAYAYPSFNTFDVNKQTNTIRNTSRRAGTETTLTAPLTAGNTTASVASTAYWSSASQSYQRGFGIYTDVAFKRTKASRNLNYTTASGNQVYLTTAYTGDTLPTGTFVANAFDGSTYFYCNNMTKPATGTWIHKSYTIPAYGLNSGSGADGQRLFVTRYLQFGMLFNGVHAYEIKNVRLVNLDKYQTADYSNGDGQSNFNRKGQALTEIRETGDKIRYIRCSTSGSTANSGNYWVELQAFNSIGNNVAFAKKSYVGQNTTAASWSQDLVTDGTTASSPYKTGKYCIVDLGFVQEIETIKVWPFYADSRIYASASVETSLDGVTWKTVYSSPTFSSSLSPLTVSILPSEVIVEKSGITRVENIVEY